MNPPKPIWGVSPTTWYLGWVSFLTDLASEIIYPLLPLFLVNVLGADKALVGLVEGIAESTASLTKIGSGWLADRTGRIKALIATGYGISALARPLYVFVTSPWQVLALRFADRVGKGIRTAPRDALIAATTPPDQAGRAFGLHRSMDTAGAILGPGLAVVLLAACAGHYQTVFLIAAIPGFLAVALIGWKVHDAPPPPGDHGPPALRWAAFDRRFKLFILAAFVFGLGNTSNAFLILRAQTLGVSETLVPLAYMLFNVVYVAIAWPAGALSDRIGRPWLIAAGYVVFAVIYMGFGAAWLPWQAWALFAGYGVFSGLTDGVQRAWVCDLAPAHLQGSAFGLYHLAVGLAALPASLLAGLVWDAYGPAAPFYLSSVFAGLALALFLASWRGTRALPA